MLDLLQQFSVLTCCYADCRMSFAVPSPTERAWRESHEWFYCPRGHNQHFLAESEAEKLKRENVAKQARIDQLKSAVDYQRNEADRIARRLSAQRGATQRLRNRAMNGVCPCCSRTFKQLAAHMKTKHPEFNTPLAGGSKE